MVLDEMLCFLEGLETIRIRILVHILCKSSVNSHGSGSLGRADFLCLHVLPEIPFCLFSPLFSFMYIHTLLSTYMISILQ